MALDWEEVLPHLTTAANIDELFCRELYDYFCDNQEEEDRNSALADLDTISEASRFDRETYEEKKRKFLSDVRRFDLIIDPSLPADPFGEMGFYTVPDLTEAERRPPEFIVEGMIPVGLTFLSGAPKLRKSFLALQLAIAVATGNPFLGHETRKCDVAYLDLEGSKSRVSSRAERMSIRIPRNVFITNAVKSRLADNLADMIRALHIRQPQLRLVIIDTYSRARGSYKAGGANAYDADVSLLEPLQRMAIEEEICVLCVHHDKKGAALVSDSFERLNGTMGISGSSDCVMCLTADGKRFDGKATLEYTPRDARGGEIRMEFDEIHGEWIPQTDTSADISANPVCRALIELKPEPKNVGVFISYADLFGRAFRFYSDRPSDIILDQLKPRLDDLFIKYKLGVQVGVQSHGFRGVRVTSYK